MSNDNSHDVYDPVASLRADIRERFQMAWNINDAAHQEEHFRDVENVAVHINAVMGFNYSREMIVVAAYFHDLFSWSRFNHHLLSAEWVRTTDDRVFTIFNDDDRELIAQACEQHRGSGGEPFKSVFAEMICAADRGFPGDYVTMIRRCMQVRFHKEPYLTEVECGKWAIAHLKEKYGTGGYARFPVVYHTVFGKDTVKNNAAAIDGFEVTDQGIFFGETLVSPLNTLHLGNV